MHARAADSQLVIPKQVSGSSAISAQMRFEASPTKASAAREFMTDTLGAWGADEAVIGLAVLVTNELVINAITHGVPQDCAARAFEVRLRRQDEWLFAEVWDPDGASASRVRAHRTRLVGATQPDFDDEDGRGLFVVNALADRWGISTRQASGGKWVWARLPCDGHGGIMIGGAREVLVGDE